MHALAPCYPVHWASSHLERQAWFMFCGWKLVGGDEDECDPGHSLGAATGVELVILTVTAENIRCFG